MSFAIQIDSHRFEPESGTRDMVSAPCLAPTLPDWLTIRSRPQAGARAEPSCADSRSGSIRIGSGGRQAGCPAERGLGANSGRPPGRPDVCSSSSAAPGAAGQPGNDLLPIWLAAAA